MTEAWDSVLGVAQVSDLRVTRPEACFNCALLRHLHFELRPDYWRYSSSFTGLPMVTGVVNAPVTGIFNPSGIPYPQAFQPSANRIYSFLDGGTHGWLSNRLETHFTLRYA